MKATLRTTDDHGVRYPTLWVVCPGCALDGSSGLHALPVNTTEHSPAWTFDGNEEAPTVSPSILTHHEQSATDPRPTYRCHSFLRAGVWEFLGDCTHALAGQHVPMVELPAWFTDRGDTKA